MRGRGGFRGQRPQYEWIAGRLSRMVEPAVLYLLGSGVADHGYDLIAAANQLGLSEMEIDPGAVYRCLRQLEAEGCVVSAWDTAGVGPARRIYQLTDLGWERVRGWTQVIQQRAQAMQQFVKQCHQLTDSRANREEADT